MTSFLDFFFSSIYASWNEVFVPDMLHSLWSSWQLSSGRDSPHPLLHALILLYTFSIVWGSSCFQVILGRKCRLQIVLYPSQSTLINLDLHLELFHSVFYYHSLLHVPFLSGLISSLFHKSCFSDITQCCPFLPQTWRVLLDSVSPPVSRKNPCCSQHTQACECFSTSQCGEPFSPPFATCCEPCLYTLWNEQTHKSVWLTQSRKHHKQKCNTSTWTADELDGSKGQGTVRDGQRDTKWKPRLSLSSPLNLSWRHGVLFAFSVCVWPSHFGGAWPDGTRGSCNNVTQNRSPQTPPIMSGHHASSKGSVPFTRPVWQLKGSLPSYRRGIGCQLALVLTVFCSFLSSFPSETQGTLSLRDCHYFALIMVWPSFLGAASDEGLWDGISVCWFFSLSCLIMDAVAFIFGYLFPTHKSFCINQCRQHRGDRECQHDSLWGTPWEVLSIC